MDTVFLQDVVQMRKPHPCGSDQWTVIRTGADIKIRCSGCGRIVMMDRETFFKRMKRLIARPAEEANGKGEHEDGRPAETANGPE